MPAPVTAKTSRTHWTPTSDPDTLFSTGTAPLDRLLGGGLRRGSFNLIHIDETVETRDRELLLTPLILNFLYHSRGMIAVLPARESPPEVRPRLTRDVSRRRFDTRVRIVDYVGEDSEAPYVVGLKDAVGTRNNRRSDGARTKSLEKMAAAERAAQGARKRPFLELVALEILEMIAGPDGPDRMLLHGTKRAREVGNLQIGILRPGLRCADTARSMSDMELAMHHDEVGVTVRGIRPSFSSHLVVPSLAQGVPHDTLDPAA